MSIVPNWHVEVEKMDELTLLARRQELANKNAEKSISIEELEELCAIFTRLRRTKVPPMSAKTKPKKQKLIVDDLLSSL